MDNANTSESDRLRGLIFTIFLFFVFAVIWTYAKIEGHEIAADRGWWRIACMFGIMCVCIGAVAWIDRRGGWTVVSEQTRRGFQVLLRRNDDEES